MTATMKIDGHVHFVGDGSNGSGCWLVKHPMGSHTPEPVVKAQASISKIRSSTGR